MAAKKTNHNQIYMWIGILLLIAAVPISLVIFLFAVVGGSLFPFIFIIIPLAMFLVAIYCFRKKNNSKKEKSVFTNYKLFTIAGILLIVASVVYFILVVITDPSKCIFHSATEQQPCIYTTFPTGFFFLTDFLFPLFILLMGVYYFYTGIKKIKMNSLLLVSLLITAFAVVTVILFYQLFIISIILFIIGFLQQMKEKKSGKMLQKKAKKR